MKKIHLVLLLLALLLPSLALASGTSAGSDPYGSPFGDDVDALKATRSLKCTVISIQDGGVVLVRDDDSKEVMKLAYDKKTTVRAQDKNAFDGRKKLEIADLAVGHRIKVLHRPATGEVLTVKVLAEKS